ncbi:hypothetical protein PsYK624_124960 [Phanerochaete sordida]|uniref:F-box domain-containing protein n=1 Tax=Phanerochaete sordida TaxID=48140 RepID=A0A9P3GJG4_9APHY|nr:hypothetical protein PsYK624_124960 [Phanerochaete sordida]
MLVEERRMRLGALRQECLELEAQLRQKRQEMSQLAPVYTLPGEIVAMTLTLAYQHRFPFCRLDDGRPHTNSPIVISHVSRWWRKQALQLPFIWACIHVTHEQPPRFAEMIKAYVARSRDLPLSVSFQCTKRDPDAGHDHDRPFFPQIPWAEFYVDYWPRFKASWDFLLEENHRWKNCSIYLGHQESTLQIISSLRGSHLPLLEYLGISVGDEDYPNVGLRIEAPNLTDIRTEGWSLVVREPHTLFHHLTDVKIHGLSCGIGRLMTVLAEAAGTLERLSLSDGHFQHDDLPDTVPSPVLPKLTYLVMESIEDVDLHGDQRTLPTICRAAVVLETLIITSLNDLCSGRIRLPQLRTLVLAHSYSSIPANGTELFLATPSLETLQLSTVWELPLWLHEAIATDTAAGACRAWPKMHSMVLLNVFDLQAIRAFAQHRVGIGKPLRRLVLSDGPLVEDGLAALEEVQLLEVAVHSQVLNETWALMGSPSLWWDVDADKPAFVPWKGSFSFDDQFDRQPGMRWRLVRE